MSTKHTPAPWTFSPFFGTPEKIAEMRKFNMEPTRAQTNEGQVFIMAADTRVALVDAHTKFKRGEGYKGVCEERDANARLIAAAPELLEALKNILAFMDKVVPPRDDEADGPMISAARAAIAKATGETP